MGKDAADITITYYVAECMEFVRYGEYTEGILSAKEAVELYRAIPAERLNAIKGIGIHIHDPEKLEHPQEFQLIKMGRMDMDILQMAYG